MTDKPKHPINEEDLARWVRELPPAKADRAFHEQLRDAFAEGKLDDAPGERRDEREAPASTGSAPWWRWVVPVAAAAAVALVAITLNSGPSLRVADVIGSGEVRIAGRSVPADDTEAIDAALESHAEIEVPADMAVDLVAKDVVLYEITGGTRMTIPPTAGRWFGRAVTCSLLVGELRLKTGEDFSGTQLTVYTPEGIIEVTGTLLSVQRDEGGTCVCVLEGVAMVGVDENDMERVEPGFRKIMLRDGTVDIIPVKPMHRDGVLNFDKRAGRYIEE